MTSNPVLKAIKFIFIDLVGDFLYFPLWWYSGGVKRVLIFIQEKEKDIFYALGLHIWLKVLFKPMYADYSFSGRLISFFMRIIILSVDLVVVMIWSAFLILILLVWLFLPVFALGSIWYNL
jgi:hypothetical protein